MQLCAKRWGEIGRSALSRFGVEAVVKQVLVISWPDMGLDLLAAVEFCLLHPSSI